MYIIWMQELDMMNIWFHDVLFHDFVDDGRLVTFNNHHNNNAVVTHATAAATCGG